MYYIGLDVHKKTISYCIKTASGTIEREGKFGSSRQELDCWLKTLPQPWSAAMEATFLPGGFTTICFRMLRIADVVHICMQ